MPRQILQTTLHIVHCDLIWEVTDPAFDRVHAVGQVLLDSVNSMGQVLLDGVHVVGQVLLDTVHAVGQILLDSVHPVREVLLDIVHPVGQVLQLVPHVLLVQVAGEVLQVTPDVVDDVRVLVFGLDADDLLHLAVDNWQGDEKLSGVVGGHDELVWEGDFGDEGVDGDQQVGYHEEDGPGAATQFGPGPEVVKELNAGHSSPPHDADESEVEWGQVLHQPSQSWNRPTFSIRKTIQTAESLLSMNNIDICLMTA